MKSAPRLYVETPLQALQEFALSDDQAHYLVSVLRLADGADVLVFNGRDGEWRCVLKKAGKRDAVLTPQEQTRAQNQPDDIWYLFAPLKAARLDYMTQKATEMGAMRLMPVQTQHTQVSHLKSDRLRANAIEAAEQCELLNVPDVAEITSLEKCLAAWPQERSLIFCDETAVEASPLQELQKLKSRPCAVLIGPEGGFSAQERLLLQSFPFTLPISLGPRILRADTAAVAALAMLWLARS